MNGPVEAARVLVACGSVALAKPVRQALHGEVEQLEVMAQWDGMASDFDDFRPDVLLFAFE